MALADVLRVLERAVADRTPPAAYADLVAKAPGLTPDEHLDLMRISGEGLRPYQQDYLRFEQGMVAWAFPLTWKCLNRAVFKNPGSAAQAFVADFRRQYPARSHSVREMGADFVAFLADHPDIPLERCPWLNELAEAERLETESLYAPDNVPGRPLLGEQLEAFFDQRIEQVLEAAAVRADGVYLRTFSCDLAALKRRLQDTTDKLPILDENAGPGPYRYALSRHPESLQPVWHVLTPVEYAILDTIAPHEPSCLGQLADRFWEKTAPTNPTADDKARILGGYLAMVAKWFGARILCLADGEEMTTS